MFQKYIFIRWGRIMSTQSSEDWHDTPMILNIRVKKQCIKHLMSFKRETDDFLKRFVMPTAVCNPTYQPFLILKRAGGVTDQETFSKSIRASC